MAIGRGLRARATKLRNLDVDSVGKELGVVSHKGAMGRKRVEPSPTGLSPVRTPLKRACSFRYNVEKSLLEALPQEILVKILCCLHHEDLDRVYNVSKTIRDASVIAGAMHFAFRTPSPKLKFAYFNKSFSDLDDDEFEDVEPPSAWRRLRRCGVEGVELFQEPLRRGLLFMESEM
ncbi:hypothetical protein Scep_028556 [Stephania cephalantha]|uniref:F-box domain-containing protein n=1 Tax=Stephania cephalantha TaxID=152367 RepID=A0AAP0HJQ0_9MAGN